jgi:glycosyltransferase involved in cell wall biosynthesis
MPKVLYLTDDLQNGGAERQLALLVKYLPSEWDHRVFSLGDGLCAQQIRDTGTPLKICQRRWRGDTLPAFALWQFMAEWKPDVVHAWGWMSSAAAGPICKALRICFIDGTIRMGKRTPRRQFPQRLGMLWADHIIANSQAGLEAWGISPSRGSVVNNGFDPDRLSFITPLASTPAFFTAVMVGSMSVYKDFRTFFNTARILTKNDDSHWHFIAIGNGIDYPKLLMENRDLIVAGKVEIMNSISEVLPLVCQAQVGVLLSPFGEGISNAIMEYMACGLPVICNDSGGNRELVVEGETGFLIPAEDSQALMEKLLFLQNNPREAERLGQAGRRRLIEKFSVETMVQNILNIYHNLLH